MIVDWASALSMMQKLERVLIVCPLSVVGVWEDEFKMHSPVPYRIQFMDKDTEDLQEYPHLNVVIVNYDLVWRRKDIVYAWDPEMVVADESHKIKKASARRSWFMRSLNHSPYRAILTGTPTPKSFLDLYSQWVFLYYRRFGTNIAGFVAEHIIYGGFMKKQIRGYRNVTELKAKVKKDASIIRKDQCLDLPPTVHQRIPVILEDDAMQLYRRLAEEFYLELKKGEIVDAKNAGVKLLRLQQLTGGFIGTDRGVRQVSSAKLTYLRDLLDTRFDNLDKVVLFCRFIPEILAIEKLGHKLGVPVKVIYGKIRDTKKHKTRTEAWRSFQRESGPSLFIGQIQSGGLGIQLQSSHEVFFYSVTYAYDDFQQAMDRAHRIGQEHKVIYRHLVAAGTVDLDIYSALRQKRDVMRMIMGKPSILRRGVARDTSVM